jgi:hypothetical protein
VFVSQVSSLTIPLAPPDPILFDADDEDVDADGGDPVPPSSSSQKNLGNSPNSTAGSGYGKKLSSSGVERRDRGSSYACECELLGGCVCGGLGGIADAEDEREDVVEVEEEEEDLDRADRCSCKARAG